MEPKKIDIKLSVKNFKVGKILHTVLSEYIADFEREHPRILPSLYRALKSNDARTAKEYIEHFKKSLDTLSDQVNELHRSINDYMYSQIEIKEGKAVPFINTDGNQTWSLKEDEELVFGGKEDPKPKKKATPKKKAPAKKRATKRKTKKEE
jgi:hypothetical protein